MSLPPEKSGNGSASCAAIVAVCLLAWTVAVVVCAIAALGRM